MEPKTINPKKLIVSILLLFLFISGMSIIQFSTPDLPDNDGFYHIKLAEIMRREGIKPNFRWLPRTILNPEEYYDHHFLFHVALIPFTLGDLRLGAKWAAVLFAAAAFMLIWHLLQRQRIPFSWLWALALLGVSEAFLFRMSITRAQSLSLGVLATGMLLILEGKKGWLFALGAFYVWMYNAFPLLPALAFLYVLAGLITERKLRWQPLAYTSAGVLAGLVVNPYFPQNILFTLRHILPKLGQAPFSGLGNEWFPYTTSQLLENSLPALIILAGGMLALGLSGRKMDLRTAFALLACLMFGVMLMRARRFVEYFPPFALIFSAFAWAPLLAPLLEKINTTGTILKRQGEFALITILTLIIIGSSGLTISAARELVKASNPYDLLAGASQWLKENTPAGSMVFQTDWDDFPRLFFYNTHNNYLIGLDPTYLQQADHELYSLWVAITRGRVEAPAGVIHERFGASFVISDLEHHDFLKNAEADSQMREAYRDNYAVVFHVIY